MLTKAVLSGLFLTLAMAQSANFTSWWQRTVLFFLQDALKDNCRPECRPQCRGNDLKLWVDYFQDEDVTTCRGLAALFIDSAERAALHFPQCGLDVDFGGIECEDALVVAARRTVLEKYEAERGHVEGGKCSWTHRSDGYVTCNSMPSCDILETLQNVSVVECIQKCCENDKCMSVDWNKDLCHLKTQNHFTAKTAGYWYQGRNGQFRHWSKRIENTEPVGCEDWCHEEFDCLEDTNDASCGACDMPECKATPEPTPAPTPHPEPGCEDWCYSEFDCLDDPNDASCGACDMPECKVGCEDWCYKEFKCLEDPNDVSCGKCDMPECNGCEDWCYEEYDCLSVPNDAACGECDLPKC